MKKITSRQIEQLNITGCKPSELDMIEYSETIPKFIKEFRHKVNKQTTLICLLCREEFLSLELQRLFAVWCARKALKQHKAIDKRAIEACDIAEQFANREATPEQLHKAGGSARTAARTGIGASIGAALWAAAEAAAEPLKWTVIGSSSWSLRSINWMEQNKEKREIEVSNQIDKLIEIFETGQCSMDDV